jgi:hypothetical protein
MNNIVYAANPNLVKMGINASVTMDYNLYWYTGTGTPTFIWGTKNNAGFAAFQSASGQEAHGIYADPKLTNPTYHGNGFPISAYNLQAGSPAIDHGANLAALGYVTSMGSRDFFGNAIPGGTGYDIGAYESSGSAAPTPTFQPPTNTPVGPTATPSGATTLHVQSTITTDVNGQPKDVFVARDVVYYRVQIVDQNGAVVNGASVTTNLLKPDSTVWKTYTTTTNASGWALFQQNTVNNTAKGVYTINVTNVVKTGTTYNSSANVDSTHQFTLN